MMSQAITQARVEQLVALGSRLGDPLPALLVTGRLDRMRACLRDQDACDVLIVSALVNIRWATGFTGSAGLLVVPVDGQSVFITDSRYEERAGEELTAAGSDAQIEIRSSMADQQARLLELIPASARVGVEADHLAWSAARAYESLLEGREVVPTSKVVENLRRTKDEAEISRLARASAIADQALLVTMGLLAEGPTEVEFARALDTAMVALGADGISFDTIIASGPNGSRPHHDPGQRVICPGDLVICDFGALVDGYHSDMTRTVCVGPPTADQSHHLDVVRAAQQAGVDVLAPGVDTRVVDGACRVIIDGAGWGSYFTHGTGHGIGLVIHEAPWVGRTSTAILAAGDVVTVEPGVYLPGAAGVRIEDSLVVTTQGPVRLTNAPKHLLVSLGVPQCLPFPPTISRPA